MAAVTVVVVGRILCCRDMVFIHSIGIDDNTSSMVLAGLLINDPRCLHC